MKKKLRGFTLAETLITLMIIGVVAVLVIPAFVTNVKEQTLNGQRKTANMKLLEGFRQMRVDGKLMEQYDSTEAFVNEMKKYFKINGVCKNDNLAGCFNNSFSFFNTTINDAGKEEYGKTSTKTLDKIKNIKSIDKDVYKNYDDFMGINFADGVNMLIAYDTKCIGPEDGDTNAGKTSIGELATCFAYFYDVNAAQAPNVKNKDIISNVSFAKITVPMFTKSISSTDCQAYSDPSNSKYNKMFADAIKEFGCYSGSTDYWAGAVYQCAQQGSRLPTTDEVFAIAKKFYGNNATYGTWGDSPLYSDLNLKAFVEYLGGPINDGRSNTNFNIPVSDKPTSPIYGNDYTRTTGGSLYINASNGRGVSGKWAICVSDD